MYTAQTNENQHWMHNGELNAPLSIFDRGLAYGDGIFTTMAWRAGQLEFLDAHLQRLQNDAQQLAISFEHEVLERELQSFLAYLRKNNKKNGVIKIIISRGVSQRGYKVDPNAATTRLISFQKLATHVETWQTHGINLRLANLRLKQTVASGAKHLNRLEQVLARAEWSDDDIHDAIMLNQNNKLIETTAANIFYVKNQTLFTPRLDEYGVKGIVREQLFNIAQQHDIKVRSEDMSLQQLLDADEVFISNSLLLVCPVIELRYFQSDLEPSNESTIENSTEAPETKESTLKAHWPLGELTQQLQAFINIALE